MKKYCLWLILTLLSYASFASPPPASEVFKLAVSQNDSTSFSLKWMVKKGFFLYFNKIKITKPTEASFNLGTIIFPNTLQKTDTQGNVFKIYRNQLDLIVPVLGQNIGEALLNVDYQGCSDGGFCYPPQHDQIQLIFNKNLDLAAVSVEPSPDKQNTVSLPTENKNKIEQLLSKSNPIFIVISFFGFGLLLAFTPCVLPMIPVLSGIIVGHGHQLSTRKAFLLSLSYVLSMSVTYSIIGAVIAFMGHNLQIVMQSSWAIGIMSILFVLLALSMFNLYELRLPEAWQNKMASITRNQSSGHYLSAAIMGCLSILILSPCVTAPLIGVLGYIAHEGSVSLGILSLFFLGLGMGMPLLLIGISAGKLLPKAGQWMNTVKSFFGVLLLAVAIYLLSRLLHPVVIMSLWAGLFIFSGIYLGAFSKANSVLAKFAQTIGLILVGYGFLILIGASQGHNNPLLPLKTECTSTNQDLQEAPVIKTLEEVKVQLAKAQAEHKPVLIDFYASWCNACKIISATTLRDPLVRDTLHKFTFLTVDLSDNNESSRQLLSYFNVVAPPVFIFYNATGQELEKLRLVGEVSAKKLLKQLNKIQNAAMY